MLCGDRQREQAASARDIEDLQVLALSTPFFDKVGDGLATGYCKRGSRGCEGFPEGMSRCFGVLFEKGSSTTHDLGQALMTGPHPIRSKNVEQSAHVRRSTGD